MLKHNIWHIEPMKFIKMTKEVFMHMFDYEISKNGK